MFIDEDLKKGGFMRQVQKNMFSMRLRIVGGQISTGHLKKICELAERYGQGYIHLTARQGVEIPFVALEDIEEVKNELSKNGLRMGVCGPRIRGVTACQGSKICPSGLIDTTKMAIDFDKLYFGKELPNKFKIGITGCPNNCLKAEENDIGVKGGLMPEWDRDECTFCGLCKAVCPSKTISVDRVKKELYFDLEKCSYCGKCVKSCPVSAWRGKSGYVLYFGGLFGNRIATAKMVLPMLFSPDEVHKATQAAMNFFVKYGKNGERFRNTIDRTGWEIFENEVKEVFANE